VSATPRLAEGQLWCFSLTLVVVPTSVTRTQLPSVPVEDATVSVAAASTFGAWGPALPMYAFPLRRHVVLSGTSSRGRVTSITIPVSGAGFTQKLCGHAVSQPTQPPYPPPFTLRIAAPGIPGGEVRRQVRVKQLPGGHCAACPFAPPAMTL
jgi:hypothetical protein